MTETFSSVPVGSLPPGISQIGLLQFGHPGPNALGQLPAISSSTGVNGTRGLTGGLGMDGHPTYGNVPEYNDFILPYTATAFGANWESASSAGQLVLTIPEGSISLPTYLPSPGTGFFGFITSVPFTTVHVTMLSTSLDNAVEIYSIDNISFNHSVPEPATSVLMFSGIALTFLRRRQKR